MIYTRIRFKITKYFTCYSIIMPSGIAKGFYGFNPLLTLYNGNGVF